MQRLRRFSNSNVMKVEASWRPMLEIEEEKEYFKDLSAFVKKEYATENVFPHPKDIFRAFDMCPFDTVKVVILGQDPYHGPKQANGLSFAVHSGIILPPSLKNIFKEIKEDMGYEPYPDGDLSRWAKQGVLLLNATLTVRANSPGSHQKKGWEEFTDAAIRTLSEKRKGIVFILWGNYAKKKGSIIDRTKHFVIESPHPSPFSAYDGFFGSKPFSKANTHLAKPIDWR
ncbi:MAG: uracil-DNA glycosylase [Candidatus Pacebacteria bacterium]|nr:uracil-DNA glycosylase [Candidatus Paceibacterota bacterium]